jgi:hypothetical protein
MSEPARRKPTRADLRKAIEERQKRVPGIFAMTAKVYKEEGGIRALYKGCVPTSAGVAPYVAINFSVVSARYCVLLLLDKRLNTTTNTV